MKRIILLSLFTILIITSVFGANAKSFYQKLTLANGDIRNIVTNTGTGATSPLYKARAWITTRPTDIISTEFDNTTQIRIAKQGTAPNDVVMLYFNWSAFDNNWVNGETVHYEVTLIATNEMVSAEYTNTTNTSTTSITDPLLTIPAPVYNVGGTISASTKDVSGVTVACPSAYQTTEVTTGPTGAYQFQIRYWDSPVITPTKDGFTFTPESITKTNVAAASANNNFVMEQVITTTKPNPAVLVLPLDASLGNAYAGQTLTWSSGDIVKSPATGYRVLFGTATTPVTEVQDGTDLTYATGALLPNTWYYWQVIPYNSAGDALNCPIWSFKTRAENSPGLATNPVPADGALVEVPSYPYMQTLSWTAPTAKAINLTGYKVYVGTTSTPTDIANGVVTEFSNYDFEVAGPGTYYWKVVPFYTDPGTKAVTEGRALPARSISVNNVKGDAVGAEVWSFVSDLEIVGPVPDIPAGDTAPVDGGIAGGGAEVTTDVDLYFGPVILPTDPILFGFVNLGNVVDPIIVNFTGVGFGTLTFTVGPGTWWGLMIDADGWRYADVPAIHPLVVLPGNTGQFIFNNVNFGAKGDVVFVLGEGDNPLPMELASFTATLTNQYFINLKWVTESETQVLGFNVYRSESNDIASSNKINAVIIPATNSSQQATYTHTDTEDLEMNHTYYYWLENVDMNGTTNFHGPISATVTGQTPPTLPELTLLSNAYPNPFKVGNSTNINVTVKAGETGTVTIYNILGQTVKTYKVNQGQHKLEWNGKGCASGIYFYKLSTPSVSTTKKLVIIN